MKWRYFLLLYYKNESTYVSINKLTTHGWILIGIVATVIGAVADVSLCDTKIVVTLEPRLRAISSTGISRWTIDFVAHVAAVAHSIATKIRGDAVATGAFEAVRLHNASRNHISLVLCTSFFISFQAARISKTHLKNA